MTLALAPTPKTQGVYWVWVKEDITKPHAHAPLSIPVLSPPENYPSDPFPCLLLPLCLSSLGQHWEKLTAKLHLQADEVSGIFWGGANCQKIAVGY